MIGRRRVTFFGGIEILEWTHRPVVAQIKEAGEALDASGGERYEAECTSVCGNPFSCG
jgi:hypothetical protein